MKRVAVIFESSPFDRKGLFNAVHNRVKGIIDSGKCEVDVYCIQSMDNAFTSKVRHRAQVSKVESVDIDGVHYNMLWYRFSILDCILFDHMARKPLFFRIFMKKTIGALSGYDVVLAHSFVGGLLAKEISLAYGTPYFVTWHGSDVHTHPFDNPLQLKETIVIMKNAECNFFVSRALMAASYNILDDATVRREVIYNGVSGDFYRYDDGLRSKIRAKYGVEDTRVVAFAGNLCKVKNVRTLIPIFEQVSKMYDGMVQYWIIGDGKLRSEVESDIKLSGLQNVRMWGNVKSEQMPELMNCMDILILPSINEGLSLVCLEAVNCGVNVVGSDVGGTAEIVGKDNVLSLGDGFVEGMAEKISHLLVCPTEQVVPSDMSWDVAAYKELEHILAIE